MNASTVGIDVGTGSVRVCYNDFGSKLVTEMAETRRYTDHEFVTQRSQDIFNDIVDLLRRIPNDFLAITVAATCSMVVREKINTLEGTVLMPFSCDYEQKQPMNDLLLWMDNRPVRQCKELNEQIDDRILKSLGGSVIPEMGLPKLKWLAEKYPNRDLVAFELHDWISYLLLVGGFDRDGGVRYLERANTFASDSMALDGSIKGWLKGFLDKLGINIEIGRPEAGSLTKLLPVGHPVGQLNTQLGLGNALVCHGCIDSYAGWLATTISASSSTSSSATLSMIAGTSTCFILSTPKGCRPIPGVWGPFDQVAATNLLEFGQPATGKLFETLFDQFKEIRASDMFELLEQETSRLEAERNESVHAIIRYYFYYGDMFGNRSPYNDNTMSEAVIDGGNASESLPSILQLRDITALVIRYNLLLEFLCFQLMQILDIIKANNGPKIGAVVISGSQADNNRFVALLAELIGVPITRIVDPPSKYNVVRGSSIASLAGILAMPPADTGIEDCTDAGTDGSDERFIDTAITSRIASSLDAAITCASNCSEIDSVAPHSLSMQDRTHFPTGALPAKILSVKYGVYLEMAALQRKARAVMAAV